MWTERNPNTGAADVFIPGCWLFFPLITSYKQPGYVSLEYRQTYRMEWTTAPLQELPWDEPLNRSEPERTFMHRQSQGMCLIGKAVVANICASMPHSAHTRTVIQPSYSNKEHCDRLPFSEALSFSFLIRPQNIFLDLYEWILRIL